jgi:hypothetical protein
MVTQDEARAYSHKNGRHAGGTAAVWLVFYALAVVGGIIANYSQQGVEVAAAIGVWP